MIIGCPKEIKPQEFRVGMTPNAAQEAVNHGHDVLIQAGAGAGAGFEDADYTAAGARIIETAAEIFATAEMIVKVKEPQAGERKMLRKDQLLHKGQQHLLLLLPHRLQLRLLYQLRLR